VAEHLFVSGSDVEVGEQRRAFLMLSADACLTSSFAFERAGSHELCWLKFEAGIFP